MFAQNIPYKIQFADVQVNLNADARQQISEAVTKLTTPNNSYLNQKIERIQLYFPIIEKIFVEENVPDDFKYLALVESGLIADAVSRTNAVGYWQFKDFTAQELGLIMDSKQDDRKNIHLSTRAAAQYLKKNNQIFKNWISTAISYNIGAGGAASLVPVEWSFANEINLDKNIHPYVLSALANKIAFTEILRKAQPSPNSYIEYPAMGKSISQIASELNITESQIRENNKWIQGNEIPTDKDYIVLIKTDKESSKVLSEKTKELAAKDYINTDYPRLNRLTLVVTSTDQPVFYEINGRKGVLAQPGDEIPRIAAKGKVKLTRFLNFNDLTDRDRAQEGLVYYLQRKRNKGEVDFHTLKADQSLWEVAHDYGIKLKKLERLNRITKGEEVLTGRVLYLRKRRPRNEAIKYNHNLVPPTEAFDPDPRPNEYEEAVIVDPNREKDDFTHIVKEGESLHTIAAKYNLTIDELKRLNNIPSNVNSVQVYQKLIVKETTPSTSPIETDVVFDDTKEDKNYAPESTKPSGSTVSRHYVVRGETLFSLANRYGMTVSQLRAINNMSENDVLKADTYIYVADPSGSGHTSTIPSYHEVKKGETLYSISNRYSLSVEQLKSLNNLSGNQINIGQRLLVTQGSNTSNIQTQSYTVKRGDTLFRISREFGVSVEDLKYWNNLTSDNITIGSILTIRK